MQIAIASFALALAATVDCCNLQIVCSRRAWRATVLTVAECSCSLQFAVCTLCYDRRQFVTTITTDDKYYLSFDGYTRVSSDVAVTVTVTVVHSGALGSDQ